MVRSSIIYLFIYAEGKNVNVENMAAILYLFKQEKYFYRNLPFGLSQVNNV